METLTWDQYKLQPTKLTAEQKAINAVNWVNNLHQYKKTTHTLVESRDLDEPKYCCLGAGCALLNLDYDYYLIKEFVGLWDSNGAFTLPSGQRTTLWNINDGLYAKDKNFTNVQAVIVEHYKVIFVPEVAELLSNDYVVPETGERGLRLANKHTHTPNKKREKMNKQTAINRAIERGIVPGATIKCSRDGQLGVVLPFNKWIWDQDGWLIVGVDLHENDLVARSITSGRSKWATVVNRAPDVLGNDVIDPLNKIVELERRIKQLELDCATISNRVSDTKPRPFPLGTYLKCVKLPAGPYANRFTIGKLYRALEDQSHISSYISVIDNEQDSHAVLISNFVVATEQEIEAVKPIEFGTHVQFDEDGEVCKGQVCCDGVDVDGHFLVCFRQGASRRRYCWKRRNEIKVL